jgi:PAS domain S-box-containing protein
MALYRHPPLHTRLPKRRHLVIISIVSAVLLAIFGVLYVRNEEHAIRNSIHDELTAVAVLKSSQLTDWYIDEMRDVEMIAGNGILSDYLETWFRNGDEGSYRSLYRYMASLRREHGYKDLFIISPGKRELIFPPTAKKDLDTYLLRYADSAASSGRPISTDIYHCELHEETHIDFLAGLHYSSPGRRFVLVGRFDVEETLYRYLDVWPTRSVTGESFLLRRQQDSLLTLSNLRHRAGSAMSLRLDANDSTIGVVRALIEYGTLVEGLDYRGVEVFSQLHEVEATDWLLAVEMDRDEALQDFFDEARLLAGMEILLLLTIVIGLALLYSNRQRDMYKNLSELRQEFLTILQSMSDAVITTDAAGQVRHLNPAAETLTGWRSSDAAGKPLTTLFDIVLEKDDERIDDAVTRALRASDVKGFSNGLLLLTSDGRRIPVYESASAVRDEAGQIIGAVILLRDQSVQRARQRQVEESERKFRALFEATADAVGIFRLSDQEEGDNMDITLTDCNEHFAGLLAKSCLEHIGSPLDELPILQTEALHALVLESVRTRRPSEADLYCDNSGRYFTVSAYTSGKGRAALVFRDITSRKQAEEALKRKIDELERFNRLTTDRELRMIELKSEINALLRDRGEPERYNIEP